MASAGGEGLRAPNGDEDRHCGQPRLTSERPSQLLVCGPHTWVSLFVSAWAVYLTTPTPLSSVDPGGK